MAADPRPPTRSGAPAAPWHATTDSHVPSDGHALSRSTTDPWSIGPSPSGYMITTQDRMIPPPAQHEMSKRAPLDIRGGQGFGIVRPLPGIWDSLRLNTAVTLPVGVEAHAACALRAWLSASTAITARTGRFATASLLLGMAG